MKKPKNPGSKKPRKDSLKRKPKEPRSKKILKKHSRKSPHHDVIFKATYSNKTYALDIFKLVLTREEFSLFDWNTLNLEITTFISKEGKERRSDLIFSLRMRESPEKTRIIFLLEHKSQKDSKKDPKVMKQLLHYQVGIYEEERDPVIIILVYSGEKREWTAPLSFQESLNFHPGLKSHFSNDVLNFSIRLLNLRELKKKTFKRRDLTSLPILYIMSHIWDFKKDKEEKLKKLFLLLDQNKEGEELSRIAMTYIQKVFPDVKWKIILERHSKEIEKEGMHMSPLLTQLLEEEKEKGWKAGLEKGEKVGLEKGEKVGLEKARKEERALLKKTLEEEQRKIALSLLKKKMSVGFIAEVTGLSQKEITKLKKTL